MCRSCIIFSTAGIVSVGWASGIEPIAPELLRAVASPIVLKRSGFPWSAKEEIILYYDFVLPHL